MIPTIIPLTEENLITQRIHKICAQQQISPDRVVRIAPQGSHIVIGQVRDLKKILFQSGSRRMLIVFELFDSATLEAQNALLKVFEEYTYAHNMLIFTRNIYAAIPTIRSRCIVEQSSSFKKVENTNAPLFQKPHTYADPLSEDSYARPKNKEEADKAFQAIIVSLRSRIRSGDWHAVTSCKNALKLLQLVQKNNLNPQLALDHWSLSQIDGKV